MVYLQNNQYIQEIYIPRQEYSQDNNPEYATVNYVDNAIANEEIRADGKYATKEQLSAATSGMATTGWVEEQGYITNEALEGYATTAFTEETYMKKGEMPDMSAYTPTSGFSTINGSAITEGGDLVIEETPYSGGSNIAISDHVISVTGITSYTGITSEDVVDALGFTPISGVDLSDYYTKEEVDDEITASTSAFTTSGEVQSQINDSISGLASTQYVDDSVSGLASEQYVQNAVSGKMDTSGMTAYATTAFTEQTYLKEHQSLAGLFDSVNYVSSAKTIYFYDKDNTEVGTVDTTDFVKDGMIDSVYISGDTLYIVFNEESGKETIAIPLSDIFNPENYYTKDEVDSAITSATSGLASTTYVDNSVSGKMDTAAMSAYSTTTQVEGLISSAKSEVEAEIPSKVSDLENDLNFVNSGKVQSQITATTSGLVKNVLFSGTVNQQVGSVTDQKLQIRVTKEDGTTALTQSSGFRSINGQKIIRTNEEGEITIPTMTSGEVKTQIESYGYVTSGEVETQITDKGYITGYTETDPVFQASPASGISAQDILDWDAKLDSSDLDPYYTSAQTDTAISNAISGLATTSYVDNSVSGKADTSALTEYYTSAQTDTAIQNATSGLASQTYVDNSVSGLASETWVENKGYLTAFTETDPIFMASPASGITAQDIENWDSVSGKVDTSALSAYTPTSGFSTINGSAITDGSALVIEGETYTPGANIQISEENEISVTGITSYTGITSGDVVTALGYTPISGVNLSDYYTSAQTDTAIADATSGKADSSAVTADIAAATAATTAATTGWVSEQGYLTAFTETDPVFGSSAASGITVNDINNWNSVSGKQETLVSGTNIKTINNQSLLGSGNITIQGGGGSGETIVELTQAQYNALTAYSENTTYVITDATEIDLNDYMKVPISGGSVNSILMNSGSQTPVWSTYKFQFISQADYNNLQTKDSTTIYFIV